tara:strand:+ start:1071 stop:1295 length:225 start_codon:yes stop_codon:yes gene_type:complete
MEQIFKKFLKDNTKLINQLFSMYGKYGYKDKLYDTNEFEDMVKKCNSNTEEEEGYVNGWTDSKDELFNMMLNKF